MLNNVLHVTTQTQLDTACLTYVRTLLHTAPHTPHTPHTTHTHTHSTTHILHTTQTKTHYTPDSPPTHTHPPPHTHRYMEVLDCSHHYSIYLALDAGQAASAGAGVTAPPAVTAALLPGDTEGSEVLLLLHVDTAYPWRPQQCTAPPGGQRLQEEVIIHLRVVQVHVLLRDIVQRERLGLLRGDRVVLGELGVRGERSRVRAERYRVRYWCWSAGSSGTF